MRIAVLGGTFNPPHYGHLFFANEVRQQLEYDKIVFVPSNISAHKQRDLSVSTEDRITMLQLATENLKWADISRCDIDRGGVTRTIETIEDIKKEFNCSQKIGFIIGDDLIDGFKHWKNSKLISERSNLIVGSRNIKLSNFKYKHLIVKNRIFPLSSSEIRDRVSCGIDVDFLIPDSVIKYIIENGLYRIK